MHCCKFFDAVAFCPAFFHWVKRIKEHCHIDPYLHDFIFQCRAREEVQAYCVNLISFGWQFVLDFFLAISFSGYHRLYTIQLKLRLACFTAGKIVLVRNPQMSTCTFVCFYVAAVDSQRLCHLACSLVPNQYSLRCSNCSTHSVYLNCIDLCIVFYGIECDEERAFHYFHIIRKHHRSTPNTLGFCDDVKVCENSSVSDVHCHNTDTCFLGPAFCKVKPDRV